jgi:hypothetical protein
VHDIGAVSVPAAPQRAAEGGHLRQEVGVATVTGDRNRAGVNVLDPDPGGQLGLIREAWVALLRVHRHLMTLASELAGKVGEPDVIAVRA